jgi:hypothetical protein
MKKKFALIGLVAASAMLIGCSSTQCRDGDTCATGCSDKAACTDKGECCGTCGGKCGTEAKECCGTCGGGDHGHDHGAKACGPDCKKPCCAG